MEITGVVSFKNWLDLDIHISFFITSCISYSDWHCLGKMAIN